ncbi:hypothetical protein EU537_03045 [Candidatus Thorarchaeota archaeon]|nr:MAG: hypothetical protein EU537_03045 [Candidatus Thorarchaeota archaeon]
MPPTCSSVMPEARYVIPNGQSACNGNVCKDCCSHMHGTGNRIPFDAYVPMCPPKPDAIIHGTTKVTKKPRKGSKDGN